MEFVRCRPRARPAALAVAVACALAWLVLGTAQPTVGASSSVTVSVTVPSAISLTNGCLSPTSHAFGTVLPGAPAITDTGSNVCSMSFQSSNDTGMLRIGQADTTGSAMGMQNPYASYINTGNAWTLQAVAAGTGNNVYATGSGIVRRSTDGGATWGWESGSLNSGYPFLGVTADPNDATGNTWYAVGQYNGIFKTTNGLAGSPTWTSISAALLAGGWAGGNSANSVVAFKDAGNNPVVVVVGDNGAIARSTNGGTSWTTTTQGTANLLGVSAIAGSNEVYAVGCSGFVRSSDAGATWSSATSGGCMYGVSAGNTTHVYAAGNTGVRTWNGSAWSTATLPAADYMTDVASVPGTPLTAYAVGENGVLDRTLDGGVTWVALDSGTVDRLTGVVAPATTRVVAVGADKVSSASTDGTLFTQTFEVAGHTDRNGITVGSTSSRVVLRVGNGGSILRSADGGSSWTTPTSTTTRGLLAVDLANDGAGWAVGTNGTILATTDGGLSWSQQAVGTTTQRLQAVSAVNGSVAYAAGAAGTVLRTTNGGSSWSVLTTGTTADLAGIWSNGTIVVVVGSGGTVRRSGDGGATFAAPTSQPPLTLGLRSVDGAGSSVWIGGGIPQPWRSTDGGANFAAVTTGISADFVTADVVSPDLVLFGTQKSIVVSTLDGGTTWTGQATGYADSAYVRVAANDANTSYVAASSDAFAPFVPYAPANAQVSDYAPGTNWGSAASTSTFGVCLQAVDLATTTVNAPTWVRDTANVAGQCQALDSDPWATVPTAMSKVAATSVSGAAGRADFVFGFRPMATQLPGTYSASVVFEALAPAA